MKWGRQITDEWFLEDLDWHNECPWCGGFSCEYLEFFPVLATAAGYKVEPLFRWNSADTETAAFMGHAECGPDWAYWLYVSAVERNREMQRAHLVRKRWFSDEVETAIQNAKTLTGPPPVFAQRSLPAFSGIQTYFICSEMGGHVKIGKSNKPTARLRELQTGSPEKLIILKLIEGDREAELHRRFHKLHINGEWFRREGPLAEFLQ